MLREKIAKIIYEGYTGLSWPDVDEHFNEAARKHADEIMELPEIKQMRKALEWACIRICADARGIQCDEIHCQIKQAKEGKWH